MGMPAFFYVLGISMGNPPVSYTHLDVYKRQSVDLTTDLHSMGQFIQDGSRIMFETVMNVEESSEEIVIQEEEVDLDGLNYLAGKTVDFVNKSAMNGTMLAHTDGNVPNLMVNIPRQMCIRDRDRSSWRIGEPVRTAFPSGK